MEFCAGLFVCDSGKYYTFCEANFIHNKFVGLFMYKIGFCTKYHIFHKNMMETITNNNLGLCEIK